MICMIYIKETFPL